MQNYLPEMHFNHSYLLTWICDLKSQQQNFTVLDYGCGNAEIVCAGLKLGLDIYGVETFYNEKNSIERKHLVKQGLLGSAVLEMTDGIIPFPDNTFDAVICNQVIEHIENLEKAIKINQKNTVVLGNLGVGYGIKGDYKKSLDYFLKAYEIDKNDTVLLKNITASYENLGMKEKAKEFNQLASTIKSK